MGVKGDGYRWWGGGVGDRAVRVGGSRGRWVTWWGRCGEGKEQGRRDGGWMVGGEWRGWSCGAAIELYSSLSFGGEEGMWGAVLATVWVVCGAERVGGERGEGAVLASAVWGRWGRCGASLFFIFWRRGLGGGGGAGGDVGGGWCGGCGWKEAQKRLVVGGAGSVRQM